MSNSQTVTGARDAGERVDPRAGPGRDGHVAGHRHGLRHRLDVPLKAFRGATEVASTQVTTMMGGFAQAGTTIRLPAGAYELRAYNDNGRDENLQVWNTRTFTVR